MTKVDINKLGKIHLRLFYKGLINQHPFFPKDFKKAVKIIIDQHFQIMDSEIALIELAWRRTKEIEGLKKK